MLFDVYNFNRAFRSRVPTGCAIFVAPQTVFEIVGNACINRVITAFEKIDKIHRMPQFDGDLILLAGRRERHALCAGMNRRQIWAPGGRTSPVKKPRCRPRTLRARSAEIDGRPFFHYGNVINTTPRLPAGRLLTTRLPHAITAEVFQASAQELVLEPALDFRRS